MSPSENYFKNTLALNASVPVLGRGLCRGARWGRLRVTTLPQTLYSRLGRCPLPIPFLPRRFRRIDLVSMPTAPRFLGPTNKYTYVVREAGPE